MTYIAVLVIGALLIHYMFDQIEQTLTPNEHHR